MNVMENKQQLWQEVINATIIASEHQKTYKDLFEGFLSANGELRKELKQALMQSYEVWQAQLKHCSELKELYSQTKAQSQA
jgi:uncharacterized protein YaaW (UPF0174 family)